MGEERKGDVGGQGTENAGPIKNTCYATGKVNYIAASKLSVGGQKNRRAGDHTMDQKRRQVEQVLNGVHGEPRPRSNIDIAVVH